MRNSIIALSLFLTTFSLNAGPQDLPLYESPGLIDPKDIINVQIKSLDHLIVMSQNTIDNLKKIRVAIGKYQAVQEVFLDHPNDKELLHRMSKLASELLSNIKSSYLIHTFDAQFIKELEMFTKIYKKRTLPKL